MGCPHEAVEVGIQGRGRRMGKVRVVERQHMAKNLRCRLRVPMAGGAWGKQRWRHPGNRKDQEKRPGSHSEVGKMLEGCWM